MEQGKTALVFGATGLIGRELTNLLLSDSRYTIVKVFVRKSLQINHPKLQEVIDELKEPEAISHEISGDHLFCCLGTTIKKAGSEKKFEWVDLELPTRIADIASSNKISRFIIISSIGASTNSATFYLKTKGVMESRIMGKKFSKIHILRPSLLMGKREEFRIGEEAGKVVMRFLSFLFLGSLRKYKPIESGRVARAIIILANSDYPDVIVESDQIDELVKLSKNQ